MTNKSKARYGIRRSPKKFALNPTARAIRNAFALGLAVAASGPALAGTCDVGNPSNATCDGSFVGSNINYAIDDLTLVVGGDLATDVQPLDGFSGIDLYAANGSISLSSAADIVASNAAAISVYAPNGDVSVENSGNLRTTYANGIDARSYGGNVTVDNNGSVTANGSSGIDARSASGDVVIDNSQGSGVSVANAYGNATGIAASSYYGNIFVTDEGVVDASVVSYGNATGINASGFAGDVSVAISDTGSVSASTNNIYGGRAAGISARSVIGASGVTNAGDISASATGVYGDVTSYGVLNRGGYYGITSTVNDGAISSTASTGDGVGWAWGIRTRGQNAEIANSGQITADAHADSGYASATASYVRGMYADTHNTGDITAHADVAGSGQALSYGAMTWGYYASMENEGNISAYASTANGTAVAMGTSSHYDVSSISSNVGNIHSDGYAGIGTVESAGVYNYAFATSAVTNGDTGSVRAVAEVGDGYAFAYGAWVAGGYSATLTNDGSISAHAMVDAGTTYFGTNGAVARSIGANVMANYGDAYLSNGGSASISAYSGVHGDTGRAYAFGAVVQGESIARVDNHGSISAQSYATSGTAITLGDIAYSGDFAVNLNYGSISADSTVHNDGYAEAVGQYAFGEVSTIVNEGAVSANSEVGSGGAVAVGAKIYGNYAATYNYGDMTAAATAGTGDASAYGVYAFGVSGSSVYNASTGAITTSASVADGTAVALGVYNVAYFYGAYVTNAGSITTTASATGSGVAGAIGTENIALRYGDAVTINNGDIGATASAGSGTAVAKGIYNFAYIYDAHVTNTGNVSAAAANAYGYAIATGVDDVSHYYGDTTVTNDGDISAVAHADLGVAQATGVHSSAYFDGTIDNSGSIIASADVGTGYAKATGIFEYVVNGDAVTRNHGDISVAATAQGDYSYAVARGALVYGNTFVHNTATFYNDGAIGVSASVDGIGFASAMGAQLSAKYTALTNDGSISAVASAGYGGVAKTVGVYSTGKYATSDINHGSILAESTSDKGYAAAHGVIDSSYYRGTTVTANYGDISASAHTAGHADTGYGGYAYAFGTTSLARYDALLHNAGSITAEADAPFGVARAVAVSMDSSGGTTYGSTLTNDGLISASASGNGYYAIAIGSDLEARYIANTINNVGASINAVAHADYGLAEAYGSSTSTWGIDAIDTRLTNQGDISATAVAYAGTAFATGASVKGTFDTYNNNYGSITADAEAGNGLAVATGNRTFSFYGNGVLVNANSIEAHADAGSDGTAFAYGSAVVGSYNNGTLIGYTGSTLNDVDGVISAVALAGGDHSGLALAIGSITVGSYADLVNHGDISATAVTSGDSHSIATGAAVTGDFGAYGRAFRYFYGTVHNVGTSVSNDGGISAIALAENGIATATGVNASSTSGDITLVNAGDITAIASGTSGSAATGVSMSSNGSNTLTNTGSITATGVGSTHVAVYSSDLATATIDNYGSLRGSILTGSLDDTLINHAGATILLNNDVIDLGAYATLGNTFVNDGSLIVHGTANRIDMGSGSSATALVPAPNPFAFTNNGTISFLDGAADDMLTIAGDFAGSGNIDLDVSRLNNTSDLLYIDGSVVDGSVSTVNVNLVGAPTSASSIIPLVRVSGDSTAGAFVLGTVNTVPNNFLTLDIHLSSDIDASNTRDDLFSLNVDVTGLGDPGALAASIAPGAQSLLTSQVGTWRQRMGVINQTTPGRPSLWARTFQDSGAIAPTPIGGNFGTGGHLPFDQRNSGTEIGADFALSDKLSVGLLLAKVDATQQLNGAGVGQDKLNGDTRGIYATWISPTSFYLDMSYRQMNFEAQLNSAAGAMRTHGDADALNLEMGYAWTLGSGLKIEPQFQYTRTKTDNIDTLSTAVASFHADGGESSRDRLGVMIRKSFGSNGTVWTPYASINAVRESDGKNRYSIDRTFFGATSTQGTSALIEGGLSVQTGHLSVFGSVNWQDGGALQSFSGGQLGLRYNW
jgi:hypothetical protein